MVYRCRRCLLPSFICLPGSSVLPHKRSSSKLLYLSRHTHHISFLPSAKTQSIHSISHREHFSFHQPDSHYNSNADHTHYHTTPPSPTPLRCSHESPYHHLYVGRHPRADHARFCHIAQHVPTNHRDLQSRPQRTSRLPLLHTTDITGLMESI